MLNSDNINDVEHTKFTNNEAANFNFNTKPSFSVTDGSTTIRNTDQLFNLHGSKFEELLYMTDTVDVSKQYSVEEIIEYAVEAKNKVNSDMSTWVKTGGVDLSISSRVYPKSIKYIDNNNTYLPKSLLPATMEMGCTMSLYQQPTTNPLPANDGTALPDVCCTLDLRPEVIAVKRKPLTECFMDKQAQEIANNMDNIKDFAATQGRNANDFYNGYTSVVSSTTNRSQSTSLCYAILFSKLIARFQGSEAVTDTISTRDLTRTDYDRYSVTHGRVGYDNSYTIANPFKGDINTTWVIEAQYTTIGWLLSLGSNAVESSVIPAGSPCEILSKGITDGRVCVIPFKRGLGPIPKGYILSHLPYPLNILACRFNYNTFQPNEANRIGDFCSNVELVRVEDGSRVLEYDTAGNDMKIRIVFVDCNDWNLTMPVSTDITIGTTSNDIPDPYHNPLDIAAAIDVTTQVGMQDLERSIFYMTSVYKDSHAVEMGFKTVMSTFLCRYNSSSLVDLTSLTPSQGALSGTNYLISSADTYSTLFAQTTCTGVPLNASIDRAALAMRNGFTFKPMGRIADSGPMHRCLLAAGHLIDEDWGRGQCYQQIMLALSTRIAGYTSATSCIYIGQALSSLIANSINMLGFPKSTFAPASTQTAQDDYFRVANKLLSGVYDMPADQKLDQPLIFNAYSGNSVASSNKGFRTSPACTHGRTALQLLNMSDSKYLSLRDRVLGKLRLPVTVSGASNYLNLSSTVYGYDFARSLRRGMDFMLAFTYVKGTGAMSSLNNDFLGYIRPEIPHNPNDLYSRVQQLTVSMWSLVNLNNVFGKATLTVAENSAAYNAYLLLPTVGCCTSSSVNDYASVDYALQLINGLADDIYTPIVISSGSNYVDQQVQYASFSRYRGVARAIKDDDHF